jgi:hypothetical protein
LQALYRSDGSNLALLLPIAGKLNGLPNICMLCPLVTARQQQHYDRARLL